MECNTVFQSHYFGIYRQVPLNIVDKVIMAMAKFAFIRQKSLAIDQGLAEISADFG